MVCGDINVDLITIQLRTLHYAAKSVRRRSG